MKKRLKKKKSESEGCSPLIFDPAYSTQILLEGCTHGTTLAVTVHYCCTPMIVPYIHIYVIRMCIYTYTRKYEYKELLWLSPSTTVVVP